MSFTRIAKSVAAVSICLGVLGMAYAFWFAFNTGVTKVPALSQGAQVLFAGIVLGVLSEISGHIKTMAQQTAKASEAK